MANVKGAAEGLKRAGITTQSEASKLTPQGLVEAAESTGQSCTWEDTQRAVRNLPK